MINKSHLGKVQVLQLSDNNIWIFGQLEEKVGKQMIIPMGYS